MRPVEISEDPWGRLAALLEKCIAVDELFADLDDQAEQMRREFYEAP